MHSSWKGALAEGFLHWPMLSPRASSTPYRTRTQTTEACGMLFLRGSPFPSLQQQRKGMNFRRTKRQSIQGRHWQQGRHTWSYLGPCLNQKRFLGPCMFMCLDPGFICWSCCRIGISNKGIEHWAKNGSFLCSCSCQGFFGNPVHLIKNARPPP